MMGQRLRRWPNNKSALGEWFILAGTRPASAAVNFLLKQGERDKGRRLSYDLMNKWSFLSEGDFTPLGIGINFNVYRSRRFYVLQYFFRDCLCFVQTLSPRGTARRHDWLKKQPEVYFGHYFLTINT